MQMLTLIDGYILHPLDINHWQSLGLEVDSVTPRLLPEKEFREQGGPLWTSSRRGRAFLLYCLSDSLKAFNYLKQQEHTKTMWEQVKT